MGFNSFHNSTPNPAQRYYKWSGGAKDVKLPDGSTAKQVRGELRYWNGEENVAVALPFTFAVLEQTSAITGFAPMSSGSNVRFYSNEVTSHDEIMHVMRSDASGTEEILSGKYSDIKGKLPQGARYQSNVYIFNPATQSIERINMTGSCLSEYIAFGQKNRGIYDHALIMEAGEKKTMGTVDFMPPKFTLGDAYNKEDMELLKKQDNILLDYLKGRREANLAGDTEIDEEVVSPTPTPSIDTVPNTTGTTNQPDEDSEIVLGDIPF